MKKISLILFMLASIGGFSQTDSISNVPVNSADNLMTAVDKLTIGGYGQVDYNQPLNAGRYENGNLDVHRLVMLFGYRFNSKVNFITEIEFEHVKEVFVEQAFLNYKINDFFNLRAGLLLIPMGIINEYHEPPTFNGVERPNLDKMIVPTTWREIGAGFTGRFNDIGLKYQLYVVNGFNGFDDEAKFSGAKGIRSGRQKGAESFMSSPSLSGKVDFYALRGLKLGLSGYFGKSSSLLYDGVDMADNSLIAQADSSVVGISMLGTDLRYSFKGFQLKGQYNLINVTNTREYNEFTGSDLAKKLNGFYAELAYNLFRPFNFNTELISFIRYENYDTHYKVDPFVIKNRALHIEEFIFGIGWKLSKGAMLKADMQMVRNSENRDFRNQLNLGVAVMF